MHSSVYCCTGHKLKKKNHISRPFWALMGVLYFSYSADISPRTHDRKTFLVQKEFSYRKQQNTNTAWFAKRRCRRLIIDFWLCRLSGSKRTEFSFLETLHWYSTTKGLKGLEKKTLDGSVYCNMQYFTSFKYSHWFIGLHFTPPSKKHCVVKQESMSLISLVSCPLTHRPFVSCKLIWSAIMKEVTGFLIFSRGSAKWPGFQHRI